MDRREFIFASAATALCAAATIDMTAAPIFSGNISATLWPPLDDALPGCLKAYGWEGQIKPYEVCVRRAHIELTDAELRDIRNPEMAAAWDRRIREALAQSEPRLLFLNSTPII